jgi:hypothetical protein
MVNFMYVDYSSIKTNCYYLSQIGDYLFFRSTAIQRKGTYQETGTVGVHDGMQCCVPDSYKIEL